MLRSIRWRLVGSYVALTLLTVSLMGLLAFSLIRRYVDQQEQLFLNSNAEAVARQAYPLLWPIPRPPELHELVNTAAFLGNVRVRVLDLRNQVIVDSGTPGHVDRFLWILSPGGAIRIGGAPDAFEGLIFTVPSDAEDALRVFAEAPFPPFEDLPADTRFRVVQRVLGPWGSRVIFEEQIGSQEGEPTPRSSRVHRVPIGGPDGPIGFVELRDGPNFGMEALQTAIRAFLLAAGGSVVLAGVVGLLMARRLAAPVIGLTRAAGQMSGGDLSVRAPVLGADEIGDLARQFNQMAERLESSFTALSSERDALRRFVADASHELRTPLTAMRNFNELLQGAAGEDPDARAEFLAETGAQINRLEWITENLLNLSRLDGGLAPMKMEELDARELLEAAAAPFKGRASEAGLTLSVLPPEPAFPVRGDRALLEVALSNLLDNALKFTPSGGQVELGAATTLDGVRLWVQDSGPGIEPEDLPHIFERFYRGRSAAVSGSGLGLAMVESVVRAHGGLVGVESRPGEGSRFTIELPPVNVEGPSQVEQA